VLESRPMDIKGWIEWIGNDSGSTLATIFPYLLLGLVGLYVLWLILGYLRVSQVGIEAPAASRPALPMHRAPDGAVEVPRGVPYCPVDNLQLPAEARFCPVCESDLLVDCANCGTTIRADAEACYRCGTRQPISA
jgi:RNA polymerase subunit RPABC4/transcription elongation factor Spt4